MMTRPLLVVLAGVAPDMGVDLVKVVLAGVAPDMGVDQAGVAPDMGVDHGVEPRLLVKTRVAFALGEAQWVVPREGVGLKLSG